MKSLLVTVIIPCTFLTVFGNNCDQLEVLLYEDLGCIPHYKTNETCPEKFSCTVLEPWTKHCHYRGKIYKSGESVSSNETKPECKYCLCDKRDDKARFICVYEDCFKISASGCIPVRPDNGCCPLEEICPPFETCEVNGKKYREGDEFQPENTCLQCTCKKGFKGKLEEPFCQRQNCGVQLLGEESSFQGKCAPVYKPKSGNKLCCPDRWLCPDGTEIFETGDDGCVLGDKIVKKGQKFTKKGVHCECVLPPLLTCKEE